MASRTAGVRSQTAVGATAPRWRTAMVLAAMDRTPVRNTPGFGRTWYSTTPGPMPAPAPTTARKSCWWWARQAQPASVAISTVNESPFAFKARGSAPPAGVRTYRQPVEPSRKAATVRRDSFRLRAAWAGPWKPVTNWSSGAPMGSPSGGGKRCSGWEKNGSGTAAKPASSHWSGYAMMVWKQGVPWPKARWFT